MSRVAFISGHLDITKSEFVEHYVPLIDAAIAADDWFIVGDAIYWKMMPNRKIRVDRSLVVI